jgi:hypothetical protein
MRQRPHQHVCVEYKPHGVTGAETTWSFAKDDVAALPGRP